MDAERDSYSVSEFCQRHGISRSKFYQLRNQGDAPVIFRVGAKPLISVEAAEAWRRNMEARAAR